jgi:GNAT superfamily N-acetyltransferase
MNRDRRECKRVLDLWVADPQDRGMTAATQHAAGVNYRRGFERGDLPAVAAMHGVHYSDNPGFDPVELEAYCAETMAALLHSPEGGGLWIAELDGEVVGSIGITRDSDEVARLRWYIVKEKARGLGVGRRLIDDALAFVRSQGYSRVWLSTVSGLAESTHVYLSVGFVLVDEFDSASWGGPVREQRYELEL